MKKKKKNIILGITGSIAAYKIPQMASDLKKDGFEIFAVITENAKNFLTPVTMEALTGNPAFCSMFYLKSESIYPHIELSKKADMLIIAPATANFIAKASWGIADDLLTTLFLTCTCPVLVAPAMNENMYLNSQTQENIKKLKEKGINFMSVERGFLACGDQGAGRMAQPQKIIKKIKNILKKNGL